MEGHLLMSREERERLKLFERVARGELQQREAAEICGLSYRQTRRLYKRYGTDGDRGLVHQARGRRSNRAYPAAFRQAVLARYQERYPDFGPTLAAEKLALNGYPVDHDTLRGWLLAARIGAGGSGAPISGNWCNWTVPITNGLKSAPTSVA
jgi:transposase